MCPRSTTTYNLIQPSPLQFTLKGPSIWVDLYRELDLGTKIMSLQKCCIVVIDDGLYHVIIQLYNRAAPSQWPILLLLSSSSLPRICCNEISWYRTIVSSHVLFCNTHFSWQLLQPNVIITQLRTGSSILFSTAIIIFTNCVCLCPFYSWLS